MTAESDISDISVSTFPKIQLSFGIGYVKTFILYKPKMANL